MLGSTIRQNAQQDLIFAPKRPTGLLTDMESLSKRDKLVLAGLYLSKYDVQGLQRLGFESFVEAFNVIGYALGAKPASIKNYRDEFDPFFPNQRKGWHKRPIRNYCRSIMEEYQHLDLQSFTALVKSLAGYNDNAWSSFGIDDQSGLGDSTFAKRLITGLAAECYFESILPDIAEFAGHDLENTTRLGCGYDFRLRASGSMSFLAVEVKGLHDRHGSISLTPKEYDLASTMHERFVLFVVRNFRESPYHTIYRNPTQTGLHFARAERVVVQVSWTSII